MNHIDHAARAGGPRSALLLLATASFLLVLDSAIVNVALPSMQADLHFAAGDLTWVVNAYALLFGGLLLLGGRLADVIGARRVFLLGLAVFGLASTAAALAPTGGALVAARAVQGMGAALVAPGAMALALLLFPLGRARNRALGLLGAAAGLGGASGALVGGLLTQLWGWPAVLWVNAPLTAVLLARGRQILPASPSTGFRDLDALGAVTATAAVMVFVYGLFGVAGAGWMSVGTIVCLASGAGLVGAFVLVERRARTPLVPRALVRLPSVRGGDAAVGISSMAMMPMWFLLTVYLQQVRGFGPVGAGAAVLPTVAMLVVFNGVAPRFIARWGSKRPLVTGLLAASVGLTWLSTLAGRDSGFAGDLVLPQMVTGIGFGLALVAGTVTSTGEASPEYSGVASGLLNTAQQVGGAVGLAVVAAVAATLSGDDPAALAAGLSRGFLVTACFAAVAAAVAWVLLPAPPRRAAGSPAVDAAGAVSDLPQIRSR